MMSRPPRSTVCCAEAAAERSEVAARTAKALMAKKRVEAEANIVVSRRRRTRPRSGANEERRDR